MKKCIVLFIIFLITGCSTPNNNIDDIAKTCSLSVAGTETHYDIYTDDGDGSITKMDIRLLFPYTFFGLEDKPLVTNEIKEELKQTLIEEFKLVDNEVNVNYTAESLELQITAKDELITEFIMGSSSRTLNLEDAVTELKNRSFTCK